MHSPHREHIERYVGHFSFSTTNSFSPVCASTPSLVSSGLRPCLGRLHGRTLLSSRLRAATSQRSQLSIPSEVRAAHTRLLAIAVFSVTRSCFEAYSALPASPLLPSWCSSPTPLRVFRSAQFLSAPISFSLLKIERLSSRTSPNNC